jgi:phosphoglycerate-specific signal transduction histidine kinase
MTKKGHPTTAEEAAIIKRYFSAKISAFKLNQLFYQKTLFGDSDLNDPKDYGNILKGNPEKIMLFKSYGCIIELYEFLDNFSESIIQCEQNIDKLDKNIRWLAKKTHVDFSSLEQDVGELKNTLLPAVKGMVSFIDRKTQEEQHTKEQFKRNGASMIV